jgi:ribose 5-phosphate isomerase B
MKIALGSDHRGAETVHALAAHLGERGDEAVLLGECSGDACDYPDGAYLVGRAVSAGDADYGVLVCGSGIGMSIAANKVGGVRASLCLDPAMAEMTRRHNDANVLCISGDRSTATEAVAIMDAFLAAGFEGGRHARRVGKIEAIERGDEPGAVNEPCSDGGVAC